MNNRESIWRRKGLFGAAMLMEMSAGVVAFAIPLLAIEFGASSFQLGSLGALRGLAYVMLCLFFGRLSDRLGRNKIVLPACGLLFVLYGIITFSTSLLHLFILMPFMGLAMSMFWPPVIAWVGELPGASSLGKTVRSFNLAWSIGAIVSALIGGMLFQVYFRLPFIFSCVTSLFILVLISLVPVQSKELIGEQSAGSPTYPPRSPLQQAYLYAAWAGLFITFFALGNVMNIFPKLAVEIGMQPVTLGLLITIIMVSRSITFFGLGQSDRWHYKAGPLIWIQILGALGLLPIILSSSQILFALGFVGLGLASGMTYASSLVYCLDSGGATGGKSGLFEAILMTGFMSGSFIGGAIAQSFDLRAPYLICFLLMILVCLVEEWLIKFRGPVSP